MRLVNLALSELDQLGRLSQERTSRVALASRKLKKTPLEAGSFFSLQTGQAAEVSAGSGYTLTLKRVLFLCSNFTCPSINA